MWGNRNFRLYQNQNSTYYSTFFDLIDGELETKQTKGLAYIFYSKPQVLIQFLSLKQVKKCIEDAIKNSDLTYKKILKADYYQVDAEMISVNIENRIRRDITVVFYNKGIKQFVLIIEAKSIKLDYVKSIEDQIDMYFKKDYFPDDASIPKCGISLTKYNQIFSANTNFASVTWNEIIDLLMLIDKQNSNADENNLLREYITFITGVDKGMNYFEEEVLSVPAGDTLDVIEKHFIHACPVIYKYKKPLYITFRKSNGGVMNKLYKIEQIIILNPNNESEIKALAQTDTPNTHRILKYINERRKGLGFNKLNEYRFYILDQQDLIKLEHNPKPQKNNPGARYYKLSELLNGNEIVYVASSYK